MHNAAAKLGLALLSFVIAFYGGVAKADDWATWGGNATRSAAVQSELPPTLHLSWTLKLREPDPAWHSNQDRVQFDRMYEPVVAGQRMFVGSMVSDRVTAYDTDTGRELWRFYTDGPVRLAPAVSGDKVYFACDDGHLYCVSAADGSLNWKFRGGPLDRHVLGNDRLISIYPARGAPVVADGTVYVAASVWPFMGVFIHALDAETGEVRWTNSGTGSMYILQQHDRPAFAGIAPQGYLVVSGDTLLVSGGQTLPAAFDRHTGKFLHYNLNTREMGEKGASGYHVRAARDFFVTNEYMFRLSDGAYLARIDYPIITDTSLLSIDPDGTLRAYEHAMQVEKTKDRKGRGTVKATLDERWSAPLESKLNRLHLAAVTRVYGTGENGLVAAIEFSEQSGNPRIAWSTTVEGEPLSLIAADDKLFVSTDRGAIYCFAGGESDAGQPIVIDESAPAATLDAVNDEWTSKVASLLSETDARTGYCVLLGIGSGRLLDELLSQSDLHVIALDPDADKVATARRRLDDLGLYGSRVALMNGDIVSVSLPPYLAQLIVSEDLAASGFDRGEEFASRVYECLRPYGGVACLPISAARYFEFAEAARHAMLPNAELRQSNDQSLAFLTRVGQLPGAADWTHQYANAGNSVASPESRVKAPLGLLWFGGPSNERVLPRHGHGPTPQVAGGRLFIEGRDMLRAVDVYTGRLLWERDFPNLGQYYDYTSHEPGANAIGSNYVSLPDSLYVIQGQTCTHLDPATGDTRAELHAPRAAGEARDPELGYLSVVGDVLITGVQPLEYRSYAFDARQLRKYDADKGRALMAEIQKWRDFEVQKFSGEKPEPAVLVDNLNRLMFGPDMLARIPDEIRTQVQSSELEQQLQVYIAGGNERETDDEAVHLKRRLLEKYYDLPVYEEAPVGTYGNLSRRSSKRLVGLNRFTGEVLWETSARHSFRHNAITAGNGKVFALDRLEDAALDHQRRRGLAVNDQRRIIAVDLATGQELWSTEDRIFGTWLGYSAEYDVLVQAGSLAGDRAPDEVGAGIVAYRGGDGKVLWQSDAKYSGPLLLHHDTVYSQPGPGTAFNLLTGEQKMRRHPVSGDLVEWTYGRDGGCNTAICSEHLITFRSSAAGFFDLAGDGGTGNWGGFRSSCTSNLIPADGVLNAPDYTRTCTCAFQNRSSLALVHMPEVETWTFNRFKWDGARVRHLGLNFGAPGDRRAPDGRLWLDFPSVGGDSPDVPVEVTGDSVAYVRHHPSRVSGHPLNWVACCGVTGAGTIKVSLDDEDVAAARPYTVRLYFAEIEGKQPGERVFDVRVQDASPLIGFDIAQAAGAPNQVVVREFKGVQAGRELTISLNSKSGTTLLCGLELVAEGW
jgi:outer membrane protein assembly factor BamB